MPYRKALVQRPSGLIKMSKEARALKVEKLDLDRKCFVGVNIQIRSKLLQDIKQVFLIAILIDLVVDRSG